MAFVPPKPRVLETSVTNHATVFALDGAADAAHYRFSNYMSVGDITEGAIVEPGVAFKSGILTYSATNQITITTTDFSKGTFGAGTKEVFMGPRAANWAELFDPTTGVGNRLRFDAPQTLDAGQESQARDNIGLGDSATKDVGTGAGTVAAGDDSRITGAAQKAANLSDLASAATSRSNLGLGDSATKNVGTAAGTVAAGDDGRIISGAASTSYVDAAIAAIANTAWTAWTPTITAVGGNLASTTHVVTAKYKKIGKVLHVQIQWDVTINGDLLLGILLSPPGGVTMGGNTYQALGAYNATLPGNDIKGAWVFTSNGFVIFSNILTNDASYSIGGVIEVG